MDHCSLKRSVCTNSLILLAAAIMDEVLLFGCDSVGWIDGGVCVVVAVAVVVKLSVSVG